MYNGLFTLARGTIFYFSKMLKIRKQRPLYHLILTFRNNKIFINFHDYLKRNYLSISTGLFIKFFEKKKLLKKSKIIRTIMAKYLRKIFLLTNVPRTVLILRKNPVFLLEFLKLFNQNIIHKFNEPVTDREIVDDKKKIKTSLIFYILFLHMQKITPLIKLRKEAE